MDQQQPRYLHISSFCGGAANPSSIQKALSRSEEFVNYPPELTKSLLAFHRKYPPLSRRSHPVIHGPYKIAAWIKPLLHERGPDTVAVVPEQVGHLPFLYGCDLGIELGKIGYDQVIYPEDGELYFHVVGLKESFWHEELEQLRSQWPDLGLEVLRWCHEPRAQWNQESSSPQKQGDQAMQRKRRRVLEDLQDLCEHLRAWHEKTYPEMQLLSQDEFEEFRKTVSEYNKLLFKPYRRGLDQHPLIQEFITTAKRLGARDFLRKAKLGLETGVERPLSRTDLTIIQEISCPSTRHRSEREIYDTLARQGRIPTKKHPERQLSRSGFRKRVKFLRDEGLLP